MLKNKNTNLIVLILSFTILTNLLLAKESAKNPRFSPIQILNTKSTDNTNVKISAAADGRIFVVWQGMVNKRYHIFFREKVGRSWLAPVLIDDVANNDDFDPALFVDERSNPHVVWVSKTDELQEIHYAHRLGSDWIFEPPVRTSRDLNLELPTIAVDATGKPFIVWQEGKGTGYSIWSAVENTTGNFDVLPVSKPMSNHYNIYPQLFITNLSPLVLWYETREEGFVLRASVFIKDARRWVDYPLENIESIPANRLPIVYSTREGKLFALWYDNINGEDHILVAKTDDSELRNGLIIDDGTTHNNAVPDGTLTAPNVLYVCWKADMETVFSQIFLTKIVDGKPGKSLLISDGAKNYYTNPNLAVNKNGEVHVVWFSNASEGGDGSIYYASVLF